MSARQPLTATSVLLALGLAACTSGPTTAPLANTAIDPATGVPEVRAGVLAGYLADDQLPDSLALLPPPPAPGSAGFAHDQAVAQAAYALRDTPRWQQPSSMPTWISPRPPASTPAPWARRSALSKPRTPTCCCAACAVMPATPPARPRTTTSARARS